ncbi:hypothetical protein QQX98_004262 [Neonectria punicea]|uniref:Mid2 domain-containing protein n=1 Tax=Neonectria punicea TaxID=979145 RepID=A0ABR1HA46_9HYPO
MDRLASSLQGTNMESLNDKANVVNAGESASSTTKNLQSQPTGNSGNGPGDTGGNPSGPGEAQNHVSFADLGTSVFALSSVPTQAFKYGTTDDDVEIDELTWQGWNGDIENYKQITRATFDDGEPDFDVPFINVSTSGASLNFTMFSDDSFSPFISNKMRLVVNWHTSELTGNTTSTIFAIVNTDAEVNGEEAIIDAANEQVSDDDIEVVSTLTASPTADSTGGGGVSDSEPTDSAASATSSAGSDSSSGDGGGLAKGAIAGIAVGAVIGVLLIGALAWFFLRKRRQNKKLAGGYTGTDSAGTYMVDKETHGRTTDSPNSPYTDDNQHVPIDDSARDTAAIGPTDRGGITRTSTSGSHGGRASTSGTQTPQGMSSNVAHLVEDGMTADEIRRLEEEERQLDDEIERAARR